MMVNVLPPPLVSGKHPGVEIVGASASGGDPANVGVRYGANPKGGSTSCDQNDRMAPGSISP